MADSDFSRSSNADLREIEQLKEKLNVVLEAINMHQDEISALKGTVAEVHERRLEEIRDRLNGALDRVDKHEKQISDLFKNSTLCSEQIGYVAEKLSELQVHVSRLAKYLMK